MGLTLLFFVSWFSFKFFATIKSLAKGFDWPQPDQKQLKVLYLSNNYIVVDKNYDVVINTEFPDKFPISVQTQLEIQFPKLIDSNCKHLFRFCHRLDYITSGALCVALNRKACSSVCKAFKKNDIEKYYLAIVRGYLSRDRIIIKAAVGDDCRSSCHQMCTANFEYCKNARTAETQLVVLEHGFCYGYPSTKVLLKPLSGRRHQLRVHCSLLGHTIVGDYTYSNRKDISPYRTFLHAYSLKIATESEVIDVVANDPFTETNLVNRWKLFETVTELNLSKFNSYFTDPFNYDIFDFDKVKS